MSKPLTYSEIDKLIAEKDRLSEQIDRLAQFIMRNIPGEPSQDEGAVDCAIRLLSKRQS